MAVWMGLSGIALAILAAGYVIGMLAERTRLERREFDAEVTAYDRQIEANEAARAAAIPSTAELLKWAASQAAPPPPYPLTFDRPGGPLEPGALLIATGGPTGPLPSRAWTDAASIAPVTMPYLPAVMLTETQRGRYPDTDTGMLDALTDTGAMRALTADAEENIARMRADNAAWLDKWGAGATT